MLLQIPLSQPRGTSHGGTIVTLTTPDTWVIREPTLIFGENERSQNITSKFTNGQIVYTFLTPKGFNGQVTLGLVDSRYLGAPIFSLGIYRYETPAQVHSTSPSSYTVGTDLDILVFGSGFRDSGLFMCSVGDIVVRAKWISQTLCACSLTALAANGSSSILRRSDGSVTASSLYSTSSLFPSSLSSLSGDIVSEQSVQQSSQSHRHSSATSSTRQSPPHTQTTLSESEQPSVIQSFKNNFLHSKIRIRLSNNDNDYSTNPIYLTVKADHEIVSASPLRGFSTGNTAITVKFTREYTGVIHCRVGLTSVRGYRTNATHFKCVTPPTSTSHGIVNLTLSDDSSAVLLASKYEYVQLPLLTTFTPRVILGGRISRVEFEGSRIHLCVGRYVPFEHLCLKNMSLHPD